ncbi:hypothetical protein LTR53_020608, partial [Teratosphaeriaceae sp. CCFEE 6253]
LQRAGPEPREGGRDQRHGLGLHRARHQLLREPQARPLVLAGLHADPAAAEQRPRPEGPRRLRPERRVDR